MRGEDVHAVGHVFDDAGSPPHARGRPHQIAFSYDNAGITPACAGKTIMSISKRSMRRDHPRMRGEDPSEAQMGDVVSGSPPHARGRLEVPARGRRVCRITPACAGKTRGDDVPHAVPPDHPRMRGEDSEPTRAIPPPKGSPPHARGRPRRRIRGVQKSRITPACAGKT